VLPLGAAREGLRPGRRAGERRTIKVGFIPITCTATADHHGPSMGFYAKQGLNVRSREDGGLGGDPRQVAGPRIRRRPHALSPCPARHHRWVVGSNPVPWTMPSIENINGQGHHPWPSSTRTSAIPRTGRGSSSPCRSTTRLHNYLLRYYVAEHGLDPDKDISIRSVPPPEMVANLRADNIDGYPRPRSVQPARGL